VRKPESGPALVKGSPTPPTTKEEVRRSVERNAGSKISERRRTANGGGSNLGDRLEANRKRMGLLGGKRADKSWEPRTRSTIPPAPNSRGEGLGGSTSARRNYRRENERMQKSPRLKKGGSVNTGLLKNE